MYTKDIMYGKICEVTSHIEYSKFDIDNINKFLIAIDKEFYQINQNISFIDVLKNCNRNKIDIDYAELGFVADTISSIGLEYSINNEIIKEWLRIIRNEAKRIVSNKILEIDNVHNGYNSIENIWNVLKYVKMILILNWENMFLKKLLGILESKEQIIKIREIAFVHGLGFQR